MLSRPGRHLASAYLSAVDILQPLETDYSSFQVSERVGSTYPNATIHLLNLMTRTHLL